MFMQLKWLVVLVFLVFCSAVFGAGGNLPGSGSEVDPYLIEDRADFNAFAADANYWGSYIRLETDVNLAGLSYNKAVIAWDENPAEGPFVGTAFSGIFDGNNHCIKNLQINSGVTGNDCLGLFGRANSPGRIENLGIEDYNIVGDDGSYFIGGLVGFSSSADIINCCSKGRISAGESVGDIGGLVGLIIGNVERSYSQGSISTGSNCTDVGGLVGRSDSGDFTGCYSTCGVSTQTIGAECVGGLIGRKQNGGTILNSYSTGAISAGNEAFQVGGLIGYLRIGDVNQCHSSSGISAGASSDRMGGLVGYCYVGCSITNSSASGGVRNFYDSTFVGGLAGMNSGTIADCWSTCTVTPNNSMAMVSDYLGGLVGYNNGGTITRAYSNGNVSQSQFPYSCNSMRVGGLIGGNRDGVVRQSYSAGSVWGEMDVGGLVGVNDNSDVNDCYSTGGVTGEGTSTNIGGLIGNSINNSSVTNSFWDIGTSGTSVSAGGTSKTTKQLRKKSTFTGAGWDFSSTWDILEDQTYPYLPRYLEGDLNRDGMVNMIDFAMFADNWLCEN